MSSHAVSEWGRFGGRGEGTTLAQSKRERGRERERDRDQRQYAGKPLVDILYIG